MELAMSIQSADQLRKGSCKPCEGGVEKMSGSAAREQLQLLDGWELSDDGTAITKSWTRKNFKDCMKFLNDIADIAEAEQHHPDMHLTGYRKVRIALMTHAIGGLSENDFILAAKIDAVA
jgi:4a-hydroxytetrahydrobiopterin dehydratase